MIVDCNGVKMSVLAFQEEWRSRVFISLAGRVHGEEEPQVGWLHGSGGKLLYTILFIHYLCVIIIYCCYCENIKISLILFSNVGSNVTFT